MKDGKFVYAGDEAGLSDLEGEVPMLVEGYHAWHD
jgi:hypothetical protein